jgi:hypothetical protein
MTALESIKTLSDEELGSKLAELCGFYLTDVSHWGRMGSGYYPSPKPQFKTPSYPLFEITKDLNRIAEIEKIVIEKVGKHDYGMTLIELMGMGGSYRQGISASGICEIATASARTRAEAALLALTEGGG